jgi:hypothetical protein
VFNNNLPVSSLFCKILLLSLPHCLPACIRCPFCSSAFCGLCAIPIQSIFCFLSISAAAPPLYFLTHPLLHLNNNNLITSLCRVLIAYVHLVHAMYRMPLPAHIAFISSTYRVLCLIIMVTLQLVWRFAHAFNITGCHADIPQPLWQSRLFVFSVLDELILYVFSYRLQSPSICQSPVSTILNPVEDALRLFNFFGDHTHSSGRDHHLF